MSCQRLYLLVKQISLGMSITSIACFGTVLPVQGKPLVMNDSSQFTLTPTPWQFSADLATTPVPLPNQGNWQWDNTLQLGGFSAELLPSSPSVETVAESPLKLIAPTEGQVLDIPSTTVILQYPIGAEVTLMVNEQTVDDSLIGRVAKDDRTNLVLQTWYGVTLNTGQNRITARGTLKGKPLPPVAVEVSVRAKPTTLTLETVAAIPADGRTTATVKGSLLDENNQRSNYNAVITLDSSAGEFVGADAKPDAPGFQVEAKQGQFTAELQAGVTAQTVRIQARTIDLEGFTSLRFEPVLRDQPLATGYLDFRLGNSGANFYDSLREFVPLDEETHTELDVTGAAFITGALGEWQYTGAFNSDDPLNRDCCGEAPLMRTFDETNEVYPVYGDNATVDVITPSTDSVFFRIERASPVENAEIDYAMWGDYSLQAFSEESQDFSAFSRTLHGFNGSYNWGNVQLSGFYATNVEGFQRDIIAPDGTRGDYFLSRRDLVEGSEEIYLEIEALERPGTPLQRERLSRGRDYQIDYDRGVIFFDRPQQRTFVNDEGRVLVRKIVATYEFDGDGEAANLLGGRLKYYWSRTPNQESWLGTTYIEQNRGEQDFALFGVDALISWGENNAIIAEYAHSRHENTEFGDMSGSAYRIEANTEFWDGVNSRAYLESTDTGFNNNATSSFVPGQTRYGLEVNGQVTATTNLRFRYERQENEGVAPRPLLAFGDLITPRTEPVPGSRVDNRLTTLTAGLQQRIGDANLTLDWIYRDREDKIAPNALSSNSQQLRSFLDVPLGEKLSLQAINTTTLSGETDAVFSDQTGLGFSWEFHPSLFLNVSQTWYTRGSLAGESITNVGIQGEHEFASNTKIRGGYALNGSTEEMTGVGNFGIEQGIVLAPGLKVDLGFEHVFTDEDRFQSSRGVQFSQPYAVGSGSSSLGSRGGTSYSVGISYTDSPDFNASLRWENFSGRDRDNTVISASASGQITPALTAVVDYNRTSSANQRLDLGPRTTLKLGLAYRDPTSDTFNALLRYEYRKNPSQIPETLLIDRGTGSEEHLFGIEGIYAPNWQWEFYGKFALRNSATYLAEDFTGTSHVTLTQLRTTYRFGEEFDLVGEIRWINQPSAAFSEIGFVAEVGYMLSPNLRLAGGYVFGEVDDRDFSGVRSADGAYLGVTVKLQGLMDLF